MRLRGRNGRTGFGAGCGAFLTRFVLTRRARFFRDPARAVFFSDLDGLRFAIESALSASLRKLFNAYNGGKQGSRMDARRRGWYERKAV
jgi:hypothetical protein